MTTHSPLAPPEKRWTDHFPWSDNGLKIEAITAGRATIGWLEMNRPRVLDIRRADVEAGRHPPISKLA